MKRDYSVLPDEILERYMAHADSEVTMWTRTMDNNRENCVTAERMRNYWSDSLEEMRFEKEFRQA